MGVRLMVLSLLLDLAQDRTGRVKIEQNAREEQLQISLWETNANFHGAPGCHSPAGTSIKLDLKTKEPEVDHEVLYHIKSDNTNIRKIQVLRSNHQGKIEPIQAPPPRTQHLDRSG
jgi:hypothetical protein